MNRELTEFGDFQHGTLVGVSSPSHYVDQRTTHVYYIPDEAQLDAGMAKAARTDRANSFLDKANGQLDCEGLRDLVPATVIAERAERKIGNWSDGDISSSEGNYTSWRRHKYWKSARETDSEPGIPVGVVKFSDPESNDDDAPCRDPIERGRLWATLQDRVLCASDGPASHRRRPLQYQDDVRRASIDCARVPMVVVGMGSASIAAYLAAHDQRSNFIAPMLDISVEKVAGLLNEFIEAE